MKHTGKPPKRPSGKPSASKQGRGPARGKSGKKPDGKPGFDRSAAPKRDKGGNPRQGRPDSRQESRQDSRTDSRQDSRPNSRTDSHKPAHGGRRGDSRGQKPNFTRNNPARDHTPRDHAPRDTAKRETIKREPRQSLGPRANMFGLHAVREAWLNPKRYIHALYLSESAEDSFAPVLELAMARGLERPEPRILSKDDFDRLLGRDAVHQGVALSAAPLEETFIQDILSIGANKARSVILILDQVTDPHNVGAILRSACAFGADGVVMQRRHAPELDGVLAKTASGAADHIPVAYETNLSRTLETLAEAGYVAIGLDEHAEKTLSDITPPEKAVLVLGAEGDGMRRLIREHCEVLVTLPTQKPINSLNVSNAAAVALYALLNH